MMNVSKVAETSARTPATAPKTAVEDTNKKSSTLAADNADKYVKNESTFTPAYTKPSAKKEGVGSRDIYSQSVVSLKNQQLKSMVQNTISGQAKANGYKTTSVNDLIGTAYMKAEKTSEGKDYWGVEATAERIFTFAKTLAGDDEKMLSKMKDAFQKGFGMAEGSFGGKGRLPGISYQTYDKVMEMFGSYENELKGTSTEAPPTNSTTNKGTEKA